MNARITFRADASPLIGTGHVMRCLTLADMLASRGAEIAFVCSDDTLHQVPRLRQSGYAVAADLSPGDLVIFDHYGLGVAEERRAATLFRWVMVIDDLPQRAHLCHVLLDQTYGRQAEEWRPWLPAHARIWAGTDYVLLRPEFTVPAPTRHDLKTILVSLGGTDPDNVTGMVLDALDRAKLAVDFHVVMGAGAPHLDAVAQRLMQLPRGHLHVNTPHMADLMLRADLAIGAGGTTAWERCSLALPSIALVIADNQRDVVQTLVGAGAALTCPLTVEAIADTLGRITSEGLSKLSRNASGMCPGSGTARVADLIVNLLKESP